ncbi:MAG: hypothetical protein JWO43_394 [Candidatus Adlerbacteria bacterium]|nr:hypothetical protein [Candidatus Adlerbacteria bacterium]
MSNEAIAFKNRRLSYQAAFVVSFGWIVIGLVVWYIHFLSGTATPFGLVHMIPPALLLIWMLRGNSTQRVRVSTNVLYRIAFIMVLPTMLAIADFYTGQHLLIYRVYMWTMALPWIATTGITYEQFWPAVTCSVMLYHIPVVLIAWITMIRAFRSTL